MTEKGFKQIFPLGEKNDAYAQYFVGQSYLSMLTTERVGIANVTFEPGITGIFITKADRFCSVLPDVDIIRSGEKRPRR